MSVIDPSKWEKVTFREDDFTGLGSDTPHCANLLSGNFTEVWSCTAARIGTGFVYACPSRRPFAPHSGMARTLVKTIDSDFSYRPIREFLGSRWSSDGKVCCSLRTFLDIACGRFHCIFSDRVNRE